MNKKKRELVYRKFDGRCGYTGIPLPSCWDVDHIVPKSDKRWANREKYGSPNNIDNLIPTFRQVNILKADLSIDEFRHLLADLRLDLFGAISSPCIPNKLHIIRLEVAHLFGISFKKPFCGKFYFEQFKKNKR